MFVVRMRCFEGSTMAERRKFALLPDGRVLTVPAKGELPREAAYWAMEGDAEWTPREWVPAKKSEAEKGHHVPASIAG